MTQKVHEEAASRVAAFVKEHAISFHRGDPEVFLNRLGKIHEGLTTVDVPDSLLLESLELKHMLSLWIVTVDDDIDRLRSEEAYKASLDWFAASTSGRRSGSVRNGPAALLDAIFERVGFDKRMWLDIHMLLAGFGYEMMANRMLSVANASEFSRLSTLTCGVIGYVDIDILLTGQAHPEDEYRRIRAACDDFATAVKLSQDAGTLSRDVLVEQNDSLVTILAKERGVALGTVSAAQHALDRGDLAGPLSEVRDIARQHFHDGVELLTRSSSAADYERLIGTVASVVRAEEDWFPASKTAQ